MSDIAPERDTTFVGREVYRQSRQSLLFVCESYPKEFLSESPFIHSS